MTSFFYVKGTGENGAGGILSWFGCNRGSYLVCGAPRSVCSGGGCKVIGWFPFAVHSSGFLPRRLKRYILNVLQNKGIYFFR
jgi:hypothetical protein